LSERFASVTRIRTMRKTVLLTLLVMSYSFHVRVTDARTALYANPYFHQLKMTDEQLERASHDRVMMFNDAKGAHWVWLMLGWPEDKPVQEQPLNDGAPGKPDLGLTPKSIDTLSIRCLQEECRVNKVTLKHGQSTDVPFDSDVSVEIHGSK